MDVLPIDLIGLVSVIMGVSVVLIPVAGLTARYVLKPVVTALGRYLEVKGTEESVQIVERRLLLLEQQIDDMQGSLRRLVEVSEFDARLRAGQTDALPEKASDLDEDPPGVHGPGDAEPE